jgi:hypothetical protein
MRILWLTLAFLFCAIPAFAATATLTWTDPATNEAGFHVHRAAKACTPVPVDADFTKLGEVGANVKTYVDSTAVAGNKYCYKVRAWNLQYALDPESAQYSPFSNLAGKDFPLAGPDAAPTGLTVN